MRRITKTSEHLRDSKASSYYENHFPYFPWFPHAIQVFEKFPKRPQTKIYMYASTTIRVHGTVGVSAERKIVLKTSAITKSRELLHSVGRAFNKVKTTTLDMEFSLNMYIVYGFIERKQIGQG